ncbi:DUF1289 domain-containing protein [Pseudomonas sp. HR96]|uniref:DUF1289 domain-containing protein n=1 Tax=Pseudomonas sp. HR96 TaxID=1027966 RepID=UPI002A74B4C5|nr:DUF1289 domain-containing protein [Pseudomonas sp. HR96]WPO98905.1 DUF1289 domain-containing protein [Pseudomonas sp. HR96]
MSSSKNPCTGLCKFPDEVCIGCGRTRREAKGWKKMDKDERSEVVTEAKARLKAMKGGARRKKK